MKRAPSKWKLRDLVDYLQNPVERGPMPNGDWVPARMEGYYSLGSRLRLAWLVFTGRADALTWPEDDV